MEFCCGSRLRYGSDKVWTFSTISPPVIFFTHLVTKKSPTLSGKGIVPLPQNFLQWDVFFVLWKLQILFGKMQYERIFDKYDTPNNLN